MYSGGGSSWPRTRSGVVRVNCFLDSDNSSCSRTRSGLVRRNDIMDSNDGSCSRKRSGLVRGNTFIDSSDSSGSIIRKRLVKGNITMDSSVTSCSKTRSGLVRGSPPVVKALRKDEGATKGPPDGSTEEEMPSRTRSGLVRGSPTAKRGKRNGLVRGNPSIKTLSKDEPVIKGLADGWLKEDRPLGTRSGLVRRSLPAKALTNTEPIAKGQPDGWLKEDKPVEGNDDVKIQSKDESAIEGLPDGWRREDRPRTIGSCVKSDPFYIDPASGFEFRSLKDVHRYLQTGDIRQCAMRPKKGAIYDVYITESQTHASPSSQRTRPGTADKGIQCEILTSEGIMLPWDELCTPYRGKNTEHMMSPESESLKAMQECGNKIETLEHNSVQPASAQHTPSKTKSFKRNGQNLEVKSKRRKTSLAASPVRVSPRLAALNVQHEVSIEPEDQLITVNLVNRAQTIEENTNDLSQMKQSGSMDQVHGNQESTYNQLLPGQADSANGMQAMQENTINHSQPSQADSVNHIQTNQKNAAHELSLAETNFLIRTIEDFTTKQPMQAGTMHHIQQTNQENTANQLHSSLANTAIPLCATQECTTDHSQRSSANTLNQIPANQEITADQLQLSQAGTVIPLRPTQECTTEHSQASNGDTSNQIPTNQENTATQLQLSQTDTAIPLHATQECMKDHLQPAKQENTADHLQLNQADTITQIQIMQENVIDQSQLQTDTVNQMHINLEISNHVENHMLQDIFSWAPEQNVVSPIPDFWNNVENQDSLVPVQIDGASVASFPSNVKFQNAQAAESAMPAQDALPGTTSDQLSFPSLFGNAWSDPCIEFAFKTLTGDIPVLDDTSAVTNYFPQQQDLPLNKGTSPNCSTSAFDSNRNQTQVDINLPAPGASDNLYNGSWFPPQ